MIPAARQNRTLVNALLLSLAAHAIVLFGQLPVARRVLDGAAPPEPIVARIAEPQPDVQKAEPEKKAEPHRPAPRRPAPAPEPRAPAVESPLPAPLPAAPKAEEPAPAAAPPVQTAPVASAGAQARVAATEGMVARTIAQYRQQVIGAAAAIKRYPPLANENNWEGAVEVQMRVRGDGTLAGLNVQKSSGHALLDEEALDMFRRAQEGVSLPPALRGRDFTLERLRVVYQKPPRD